MSEFWITSTSQQAPPPNPWDRISEIAARVGVPPDDGKAASLRAQGADGQWYDLMAVVIGVLDHLDKAASK